MRKLYSTMLLMAIVMMAMSPMKMWAYYAGISGSGTEADPYEISCEDDLKEFRDIVNGLNGKTPNSAAWARVTEHFTVENQTWTPIGSSTCKYTGTFDGNDREINMKHLSATGDNFGLFGYINGATIKNLTIAPPNNGYSYAFTADYNNVGTLVGYAEGASQIINVVSSINLTISNAHSHIGGIVGYLAGSSKVMGCSYFGTLNAGSSYDCIGGIVGYAEKATFNGSISYCLCNGTLKTTSTNAETYVGGILGFFNDENKKKPTIEYNYTDAKYVNGNNVDISGNYINAIIGRIRNNATNVKNNYYLKATNITRACNTANSDATIDGTNKGITIIVKSADEKIGTVSTYYLRPWSDGTSKTATLFGISSSCWEHYNIGSIYDNNAQKTLEGEEKCFSLNKDYDITVYFTPKKYRVYPNYNGHGTVDFGGTTSGSQEYGYGTTTNIYARPDDGYYLDHWSDGTNTYWPGDDNCTTVSFGVNVLTFTVEKEITYTAYFKQTHVDFSYSITNNPTSVTISQPSVSFAKQNYPSWYEYGTKYGTEVQIKASEGSDCRFVSWSDGDTTNPRKLTVTGQNNPTAVFEYKYDMTGTQVTGVKSWAGTELWFPEGATSIADNLLKDNTTIKKVIFPQTLTSIGSKAFSGCSNLYYIWFKGIPQLQSADVFEGISENPTVSYTLDDNSVIYTGNNYLPASTVVPYYYRAISAASNWGTLVVPFEAKSDYYVQLYELTGVVGDNMIFSPVETVAANTPCVFKKKIADDSSVTIKANSTTTAPAAATPATPGDVNGLAIKGTYTQTSIGGTEGNGVYFIAQDQFWRADAATTVKPFRAWFEGTLPSGAKSFNIVIEDETDGISELKAESLKLKEGKYLENGRVVIVRNGVKYNTNGQAIK